MPAPYSNDLRKRVIESYESKKLSTKEIVSNFNISLKTLYRWLQLKKKTGNINPKQGYQKGHSHAIKDLKKFEELVNNSAFSTVQDIVNIVNTGTVHSIGRALKKIKYVKKKV
jgi:transposase